MDQNALRLNAESFFHVNEILQNQFLQYSSSESIICIRGSIKNRQPPNMYGYRPLHLKGVPLGTPLWREEYAVLSGRITGKYIDRKPNKRAYDLLKSNVGLHIGTGSEYSIGFAYDIDIFLCDFPKILEKYDRLLILNELRNEYMIARKIKEEEYEEYLKWKIFSDIFSAVHMQELKELEIRKEEIQKLLASRKIELDNERIEKMSVSIPNGLDFDEYTGLRDLFVNCTYFAP